MLIIQPRLVQGLQHKLLDLAARRWNSHQPSILDLQQCRLDDNAAAPIWTWRQVSRLDLQRNNLRVMPELDMPALLELNISQNWLRQLPRHLHLPKLIRLQLYANHLTYLPDLNAPALERWTNT